MKYDLTFVYRSEGDRLLCAIKEKELLIFLYSSFYEQSDKDTVVDKDLNVVFQGNIHDYLNKFSNMIIKTENRFNGDEYFTCDNHGWRKIKK